VVFYEQKLVSWFLNIAVYFKIMHLKAMINWD